MKPFGKKKAQQMLKSRPPLFLNHKKWEYPNIHFESKVKYK
jgi:hypothetical protein